MTVGLLLTTFGSFWAIEGLGWFAADQESLEWPLGDVTLLVMLAIWVGVTRALVVLLRRRVAIAPSVA